MQTKLLAVERALTDLWSGLDALEGVTVSRGWPGPVTKGIWTTDMEITDDFVSIGALSNDEHGTIRWRAEVVTTPSPQDPTPRDKSADQLDVILDAVVGSCSGSPAKVTLSGLVIWIKPASLRRTVVPDDAKGSNVRAIAEGSFAYFARIDRR